MKKTGVLFISLMAMSFLYAQNSGDALRYSQDEVLGTARFRALSGAFGALGGDMSAVSMNPAGSAFFTKSHASISLSLTDIDNKSDYFGTENSETETSFKMNQLGAAFVFKNQNSASPWSKMVLSINYEQTHDYENQLFISGTNLDNSIGNYFLEFAQGKRLDQISAFSDESDSQAYADIGSVYGYQNQQAFLGYESYILEPEDDVDDNVSYTSNIAAGSFYHEYSYITSGSADKISFNGALKYEDKLYLGLNLNAHVIEYRQSNFLYEDNENSGSLITTVGFENNLKTIGTGFSFQLGGVYKLNNIVRVGASYHSPVWYTLEDETWQYLDATRDESGGLITEVINPQVINVFEEYKIQTPDKLTGSIALLFEDKGLLSFDYTRKNYSNAKFRPSNDAHFRNVNNTINSLFTDANEYRLGGELRHKQFSVRGGYRFEESPYSDGDFYGGDLKGFSLGAGISLGNAKLDFAYQNSKRDVRQQLYYVGLTDTAKIETVRDNFILTLGFNF